VYKCFGGKRLCGSSCCGSCLRLSSRLIADCLCIGSCHARLRLRPEPYITPPLLCLRLVREVPKMKPKTQKSGKPGKPTQHKQGGPSNPLGHGLKRLCRPFRLLIQKLSFTHRGGTKATIDAETVAHPPLKTPSQYTTKETKKSYKQGLQYRRTHIHA
jgi:hypothetical protein